MASLSLRHVDKAFGAGGFGVRDLSLEVEDGEFLSLVGPSGCGKSTTLNLIAGLETPTRGEILIGDRSVNGLSPGDRDVALVFQSYALYPHLSVHDNIAFPLKVAGLGRAERGRRVRETAERLGLVELLPRRPRALSGGQRQRVALARALVRRPKVFLFDEPLSNLDASLRAQTRAELKALHAELGATFVYVTHDQAEAMTLSDRVAVMSAGVLQQVAPPEALYEHPENLFVARFFGTPSINIAKAEVWGPALEPHPGANALYGLRPEDLEVGLGMAPEGALEAEVFVVEPVGAESFVTMKVRGAQLVARGPAFFRARSGDRGWVRPSPGRFHAFDAQTGAALGLAKMPARPPGGKLGR